MQAFPKWLADSIKSYIQTIVLNPLLKSPKVDNQWVVDWELKENFTVVYLAGVGSRGTGSSHRELLPGV